MCRIDDRSVSFFFVLWIHQSRRWPLIDLVGFVAPFRRMHEPNVTEDFEFVSQRVQSSGMTLLVAALVGEAFVVERMRRAVEEVIRLPLRFVADVVGPTFRGPFAGRE